MIRESKREDRLTVPELVRLFHRGDNAGIVDAILEEEDTTIGVSQVLWMVASLMDINFKKVSSEDIRNLSRLFADRNINA